MGQRPLKATRDSLLSEAGSWKCRRASGRRVLTTLRLPLWTPRRQVGLAGYGLQVVDYVAMPAR